MSSYEYTRRSNVQTRHYPERVGTRDSRFQTERNFHPQSQHSGEIMIPRTLSYDRNNNNHSGRNYSNPPSQPRYPSQSRYSKNRRKFDDDDLSALSYATPVISNRTSQQLRKKKKRDSDSDITPIISNREYGGRYMESQKSFSDVSDATPIFSRQRSQNEMLEDYQQSEGRSSLLRSSSGKFSIERRNSLYSVSSGQNSLFSIPSGQIPVQLQSKNSSPQHHGTHPNNETIEIMNPQTKKDFMNNLERSSSTSSKSRSISSTIKRGGSGSSRSKSSEKINNEIDKLRNEMEMNDRRSGAFLGQNCNIYEVMIPSLLCGLFLVQLLLSSFATLSCRYVTCNVGFKPLNVNFQQSAIEFGFWSFYSQSGEGTMRCMRYPADFAEMFIVQDSMWIAARIIGVVNILIGSLVLVILSITVGQKVLQRYYEQSIDFKFILFFEKRWKDITLFCSILLLLWELVKFVFTNIELCSKEKWMNDMGEMVAGQGCSISTGGLCTIFAVIFDMIIILILVFSESLNNYCSKKGQEVSSTMNTLSVADGNDPIFTRMSREGSNTNFNFGDPNSGSSRNLITEPLVRESSSRSNGNLITEPLVREPSRKGDALDGMKDTSIMLNSRSNSGINYTQDSRLGFTPNKALQKQESTVNDSDGDSNGSFDSDKEQIFLPMPTVQKTNTEMNHNNHAKVRTSIGFYANLDDSLGMPKF